VALTPTPADLSSLSDPRSALPAAPAPADELPALPGTGRLVAVWGPTGAPGRTTLAVGLAAELAQLGQPTLLVDADVYGGVVAQVLGLLDESPGLAAACRQANNGLLDVPALAALAREVAPALRVLTGIARADRWPELRPAALEVVLALARSLAAVTVVDCGFALEQDEELSYDTTAPRRNGATLSVLEQADTVVVVGTADPVGLQRLVRGLSELKEAVPGVAPTVVVNRLRASAVPGDAESEVRAALRRYAGVEELVVVPHDVEALDAALSTGRTLAESAPGSLARQAISGLAAALVGAAAPARKRRLLRR
jgi:Flp pilus assembly CpaE family ATPase